MDQKESVGDLLKEILEGSLGVIGDDRGLFVQAGTFVRKLHFYIFVYSF